MASVLLASDKEGGHTLSLRVCVCVQGELGERCPLPCVQRVQLLRFPASVYTVGAFLLSERQIQTKSKAGKRADSEVSAHDAFQTKAVSPFLHVATSTCVRNKKQRGHAHGS